MRWIPPLLLKAAPNYQEKTQHAPGFWLPSWDAAGACLAFLSVEIRAMGCNAEAVLCTPGSQPNKEPECSLWQHLNKISNGSLQLYKPVLLEMCLLSVEQCCREISKVPWNKLVQKQSICLDPALHISFSSQLISYFHSAHGPHYMQATQFKASLLISSF